MQQRIGRRTFVARLAGSAVALGLAALGTPATTRIARAQPTPLGPIPVRIAEVTQSGPDFRSGLAEGVALPGSGGSWALTAERGGGQFTSAPLQIEFPCSHVGAHWHLTGERSPLVDIRTSRDGERWSSWRRVLVESVGGGPQFTGQETFGALVGGRLGTWLQYRLTFAEGAEQDAAVERVTLTYLDARAPAVSAASLSLSSAPLPSVRAGLTAFLERVVTREQWGADESIRFADGKDLWPRAFVAPKFLAVHHTAGENEYADPAAEIRAIYTYHTVTQGWGDIGYHLLIDNRGQVYEGRIGRDADPAGRPGREVVSENVVAGHAFGYNYGSVGIALLGNFMETEPSDPALQTLEEALAFEASRHGIDPTERISFLRLRTGGNDLWRDDLASVPGHRDCVQTECPGDRLYARLPEIRDHVATRLGPPGARARITRAPSDRNVWPGDLVFAWEGENAADFSTRLEGWRLSSEPDRIVRLSGYTEDERPTWSPWSPARAASFALPRDARGSYTLHVRARDSRGREGLYAARSTLFVDRHVLVDNADEARTARSGTWTRTSDILGFNGADYEQAEPAGTPAGFAWTLDVPESGSYRVLANWTEGEFRATNARFTISSDGRQLAETEVSQRERGETWGELAKVDLVAGSACRVELANDADGVVVADAIRIVLT
jgi:hypothetical protein